MQWPNAVTTPGKDGGNMRAHSRCGVVREPWLWDSRWEGVCGDVSWLLHASVGETEKPVSLVQGETTISC